MIAKCSCQNCGVHIEFEAEDANQIAPCPSCGTHTRLVLPTSSSKNTKTGLKYTWRKDWPKAVAGFVLLVIIASVIWAAHRSGTSWAQISGVSASFVIGIALIALLVFALVLITHAKLWMRLLSAALVTVGILYFLDGVLDWCDVLHRANSTIMQQQLSEFEMVGGALMVGVGLLVYIGQRILKAIIDRK